MVILKIYVFAQWLKKLERTLDENRGFAIGNKLSLADVIIYNWLTAGFEDKKVVEQVPKKVPKEALAIIHASPFSEICNVK